MAEDSRLRGIYPVLYTFFDQDGRIDAAAMRRQVDACINAGAGGVTMLGIAGESIKLDVNERRQVMEIVATAVGGRVPLAPIINEMSILGQIEFVRAAESLGASMVILQPPQIKGTTESELVRFLGTVADSTSLPVAIQNNLVNLEVTLRPSSLKEINGLHQNVCYLKGEAGVTFLRQLLEEIGQTFKVFSGLGARELPLTQRIGCVGAMPAPDWIDVQSEIFRLLESGRSEDAVQARKLHRSILPAIEFVLYSPAHMLCYGKRAFAMRAGISQVHDRAPAVRPTELGLEILTELVSEQSVLK